MLNASSIFRTAMMALAAGSLSACGGADQPAPAETAAPDKAASASASAPAPAPAPSAVVPIDLASADAGAGKSVFAAKCSVCHSLVAGEGSAIGPHLDGVVDRKIASVADFAYSPALSTHGGQWDIQSLSAYLTAPQKFAPGTGMGFAGMTDASERANVIAYLASTK